VNIHCHNHNSNSKDDTTPVTKVVETKSILTQIQKPKRQMDSYRQRDRVAASASVNIFILLFIGTKAKHCKPQVFS
jgi:hypothetical protein